MALDLLEGDWEWMRQVLLQEMMGDSQQDWERVFNTISTRDDAPSSSTRDNGFAHIYSTLDWRGTGNAPYSKWMEVPATALLIAQVFGVVVQLFSADGACTVFPLFTHPDSVPQHRIISIAFVNGNHYIMLKLADGAPMPYPSGAWSTWVDVERNPWLALYGDRIEAGRTLSQRPPQYCDLTRSPSSSDSSDSDDPV